MQTFQALPTDILYCIFSSLSHPRDLFSCALLNKASNRVVIPLLYRDLDSRDIHTIHPSTTLLAHPYLALYVHRLVETGACHELLRDHNPHITEDILQILPMCMNLRSLTWIDAGIPLSSDPLFLKLLAVLPILPLLALTIQATSNPSDHLWNGLSQLKGLMELSIWCMEGPSPSLFGWAQSIGSTLRYFELNVSSFSTSSACMFERLPLLEGLRLKGIPASTVQTIIAVLPNLQGLETDYLPSSPTSPLYAPNYPTAPTPYPCLPVEPCLESLNLDLYGSSSMHRVDVPKTFIQELMNHHHITLREFLVGTAFMELSVLELLVSTASNLQRLAITLADLDVTSISHALKNAASLSSLVLEVRPSFPLGSYATPWTQNACQRSCFASRFTAEDARFLMAQSKGLILMSIQGRWVTDSGDPKAAAKGLCDEKDITVRGLEAVKGSTRVYLEAYTSILMVQKENLEAFYGKELIVADRDMVETQSDDILSNADKEDVSLLVVGDPLGATTHTDIVLRARALNIPVRIINNASIMNAVGVCGLQLYNFGQTVSLPFFTENWKPDSWYGRIKENQAIGLHTLVLLDIKVKEQSEENLARGRKIYEPPRYMSIPTAVAQLIEVEQSRGEGVLDPDKTLAIALSRVGRHPVAGQESGETIVSGTLSDLANAPPETFGQPLHSLVIVGKRLHYLEVEYAKEWALDKTTWTNVAVDGYGCALE
ncbi:hypothetical protein ONZ45_g5326 [Pleurotus djamor]|nr:hypothetical protein ONZ45_g5326 [Pleurotus djamor]